MAIKLSSTKHKSQTESPALRWAVVAAIGVVLFFASYRFAVAQGTQVQPAAAPAVSAAAAPASTSSAGGGGCCSGSASGASAGGCCGGAKTGPAITGSATVQGGVQTISVDLSKGYYAPNTIRLKAGVPAEITFGRGSGCLGVVQSQQLGFRADLTAGAATVKLDALRPGTYGFTCGMGMVSGSIVVQ